MVLYWCGSCIIIDMRSEKGKTGMRGSATQVPEVEIPGFIILMICNFVEFPVIYCVYGSARIGYMFLGVVGVVLFLGREWRWVGAGVVIALDAALVLCRNLNLDAFLPYSQQENPIAAFMDFVIASASITVMLVVLLHKYEMQQLQLQEMSDELQEMVHLDPLTKLYNRRSLTEHLDEKITRGDNEFAVALLDIIDRESKTVSGVRTDEGTDRCHCGVFSPKLMEAFRAVRR